MGIYFFTIQVDFPGTFDGSNSFSSLSNAFPIAIFTKILSFLLVTQKEYLMEIFFLTFKVSLWEDFFSKIQNI